MKANNRAALKEWVKWQAAQGRTNDFMDTYTKYMTKAIEAGERRDPKFTIDPPASAPTPRRPAAARPRLPEPIQPTAAKFWVRR